MRLPPERDHLFRRQATPVVTFWRGVIVALIALAAWALSLISRGVIQPISNTTPTPTRSALSFEQEGEALFEAGDLAAAIARYEEAIENDATAIQAYIEVSRILVYHTALLTEASADASLLKARGYIDTAVTLDDFSSDAHAVRTLVYDWSASYSYDEGEEEIREEYLAEASKSAVRAVQLDTSNALAYAYRAEVLSDQLQFTQANELIQRALDLDSNSMDVRRIYAFMLESQGFYSRAIDEYKAAANLAPNYTYLYIKVGQNYRQLGLYDQALEYFDRAASINKSLGITDPVPYLAIAKTYVREGQFFAAALNAETAVSFDPTNPSYYGELGIIRFRARNYEGSTFPLKCATLGCTADENEDELLAVIGLPLDNQSVPYYYTYGSVLAALNRCDEAKPILNLLMTEYAGDELVTGIAQESLAVCAILEAGGSIATSTPPPEMMDDQP